nr:putative ribonuclease H-like domain-containing protein [Tanacetum cinerariifolium]
MNRHTKDLCFKIIGYPDWWIDRHKTASNKGARKINHLLPQPPIPGTPPKRATIGDQKRIRRGSSGGRRRRGRELLGYQDGRIIRRGIERDGLYYVDEVVQSGTVMLAYGTTEREAWLWHRRLGHPSVSYLHTLFPDLFPLNKPRYGVNKKGYRCYSPKTHRLFTSMNCDFVKTQYYYSPQHSGLGEEQLSWLRYTSAATIGNEIQNHSTTSTEANISATPEHP